jgi:hypothetical protein
LSQIYITTARVRGTPIRYEIEADSRKQANAQARKRAYRDGHRGPISFRATKKEEVKVD